MKIAVISQTPIAYEFIQYLVSLEAEVLFFSSLAVKEQGIKVFPYPH